jgi:hypothetical protein
MPSQKDFKMSSAEIVPPFQIFSGLDGLPLNSGYIYVGAANLNPEASPIATFWDSALTIPAPQPIRTISGYPSRSGTAAQIFISAAACSISVKDKNQVLVYSVLNVVGVSALAADLANATDPTKGAALVGYMSRTVRAKLQENVSVLDYGATGDGVTDDTVAISTAVADSATNKKALYWPAGTYISSGINAAAGMTWLGDGPGLTTIKLKSGTNAGLVKSATFEIDDVYISGITFHGNSQGNTSGDTLVIHGARSSLVNVAVIYSAGNAIDTDWLLANGGRLTGCEGFYSHVTIDSSQLSGWLHSGPSDSHFESVIIIDSGLKTNNSYYGMFLKTGPGNGRFFNLHTWNRDTTTNVPISSVYVQSSGNNFTGCHIEGGTTSMTITGAANTFASGAIYAPRGAYSLDLQGSSNSIQCALGLTFATANPSYKGILLGGPNNIIEVVNSGSGCTLGAVEFGADPGQNNVTVAGNQATGVAISGTPNKTDNVSVFVSGAAGMLFMQTAEIAWMAYTPTLSATTGTLTSASATGRYMKVGKTVNVEMKIIITTNGTAAGSLRATLPFTCSAFPFVISGREDAVTGKMLQGNIGAGSNQCFVFAYDGTYAGGSGYVMQLSGTYEVA